MKARTPLFGIACACLTSFTMSLSAYAANGTWTGGGNNTNWTNIVNWSDGIAAGGASAPATFSGNGSNSILLDTSVTLGSLNFSGTSANTTWTLSPSGSPSPAITMARSGQTPSINVGADVSAEISVALGGNSGLAKTGAGQLTLSGANGFTGLTTINSGTLALKGAGQVGNVSLADQSSVFDLSQIAAARLSLSGLTGVQGSGVRLGDRELAVSASSSSVLAGSISGEGGSFIKGGSGTLTLSGTNTYTGNTTVEAGSLKLTSRGALYNGSQDSWTKDKISVASGAALTLNVGGNNEFTTANVTSILNNLTAGINNNGLKAGSSIGFDTTNAAGGVFTIADNISDSSGVGSGSLGITKIGSNTLELSGANTYSGTTSLQGGTLKYSGSGNLTLNNLATSSGTHLDLSTASGSIDIAAVNAAGSIGIGARSVSIGSANGASSISGNITGTGGSLTKEGAGSLTLSGTNTYTGNTTVESGTLGFAKKSSLYGGVASNWTKEKISVGSNATLALGVGGDGQFSNSDVTTLFGNLATGPSANGLNAGSNIGFDTSNASGGSFTLGTSITDRTGESAGSIGLAKLGGGTLQINSAHSYTGATTVESGTLKLTGNGNLSAESALHLTGASAVFEMDKGNYYSSATQTLASLSGVAGSQVKLNNYKTLIVGGDHSSTTFAGSLVGSYQANVGHYAGGNFTKTGNGALTLTGANLNGGTITIAGGALAVAEGGSLYWHSNVDLTGSSTTLDISEATPSSQNIRSLSGVSGSNVELGSKTLTLGSRPASAYPYDSATAGNYSGNITGDGGALVKSRYYTGSYQIDNRDVQVLSGTNTYTGNTTILGGTLQFAKQSSLYNHQEDLWTKDKISVSSRAALALNVGGADEFTTANVTTILNNLTTGINNNGLKAGSSIGFDTTNAPGGVFTIADNISDSTGVGGGSLGITKLGSNTLELSGANTNTGNVLIVDGTLKYTNAATELDIYRLSSSTGSTLDLSQAGNSHVIEVIESGGNLVLGDRHLEIGVVYGGGYVSGNISGVGASITKTGSSLLSFSGNNSYTGATTINEGELHFGSKASLYGGNSTQWNQQNIKVASGATLGITVGGTHDGTAFSAADVTTILSQLGSNVTNRGLQAGSTLHLQRGGSGTFVYSGNISNSSGAGGGSIGLDLTSYGERIVLSGNNTYTGPTDIDGAVQFAKRSSLYGGDTSKWNRSNISGNGELALNVGGAGEFTAGDVATIVSNVGEQYSGYSYSGFWGALGIDTSSASTNLGSITTNLGSTTYINDGLYSLRKFGENTLTIHNSNFEELRVDEGVLRLTGTQSADRYYVEGGTLKFAGEASIASGSEFSSYSSGGNVDISELGGAGLTIAYSNYYGSQWNLGNKTLTVSNNKVSDELYESYRNVSYISDVSGEGGSLAKTGSSTLVVDGDNSYTGKTSANGGILVLRGNSVSQLEVNNGGRLLVAGMAGGNAIVNGGRLDVGNVYDSATDKAAGFYGNQTGPSWNYIGDGILSGNATVKAGGTLGGHGMILGLTSVETGGRIAPGTSIGSLSVASITFANNSTYEYEVNSSVASLLGADLLVVNGDLNMTLTQLAFSDLSQAPQAFGIGTIFSLMNYTGTWNGGLFALGGNVLNEGEEFYAGQNYWRINYNATAGGLNFNSDYLTGNTSRFINLTATAVPEPSVAMLAATAGLFLLRRRRAAGRSHGCS